MKRVFTILALVTAFALLTAGTNDRFSEIELDSGNKVVMPEISAPSGNPLANKGWLYVKDNSGTSDLYFEDDGGTVSELTSLGTVTESFVFEGGTADAYETTLTVVDPTADRTVTIPNSTGAIVLSPTVAQGEHAIWGGNSILYFEGATGDAYETSLSVTDPTADRTVTIPDEGGTVVLAQTGTTVHYDTVELSNADIKALRATPKELVAAPGAHYFLEFVSAVLILDYGSNALTESADNLVIQYGTSGADVTGAIESTGFIDQEVDQMAIVVAAGIATDAASDIVNNNLELFNTGDGELGGNAGEDTTMTVKIAYRVHADGL